MHQHYNNTTQQKSTAKFDYLHLALLIKKTRQDRNLNLTEAAKLSNISRHSLSKLEKQKLLPAIETVEKLCTWLNLDVNTVLNYRVIKVTVNAEAAQIRNDT